MPRSLARLRYRPASIPITSAQRALPRITQDNEALQRRVRAYVEEQSKIKHLRVQTVVNEKARRQPTGKRVTPPVKPYTLRDVVDPKGVAQHGEIIYIFRNTKTNQIIYSLQELLDKHHLEQLPFIGKHSKPPVLRPDEWVPHCVITFPTPLQGQNAYRQLREFRKLHEISWQKTNPEFIRLPRQLRVKKIMDQRANTSADLAEVLRGQQEHGEKTAEQQAELEVKATAIFDKRWQQIDALAKAALAKEKPADNVKWLQGQVKSVQMKLRMKHNQNDADQKRLKAAKESLETRLGKVQYALRKAEQFKNLQEDLTKKAAPANEMGSEARLEKLKAEARVLQEALDNPNPTQIVKDVSLDQELLAQHQTDIAELEQAFEAKRQAEARDHYIARSVLPRALKKEPTKPYTLDGVSIRWADLQDAFYASGQWPEVIEHEPLEMNRERGETLLLSAEASEIEKSNEVERIMQALRPATSDAEAGSGIAKFLPKQSPFKSATA